MLSKGVDSISDSVGDKKPPSSLFSFPTVSSTNVKISLKNSMTLTFYPFARLAQNFKATPCASPKLFNLNQNHSSRNDFSGEILIKIRL